MVSYAPPTFNLPIFEPSVFGLPATSGGTSGGTANFLTKAVAAATYQTIADMTNYYNKSIGIGTVYSYIQTTTMTSVNLPYSNNNVFSLPTGVYVISTNAYCSSFTAPSSTNYLYNLIQITGGANDEILLSQVGVPTNQPYTVGSTSIITIIAPSANLLWTIQVISGTMSVIGNTKSYTFVKAVKIA